MTEQPFAIENLCPDPGPARRSARGALGCVLALGVAVLAADAGQAATVTISDSGFATPLSGTHDNFGAFTACGQGGPLSTSVGSFVAGGRAGGGGSVCGRNTSEQVRTGENYGRDGHAYLDSNDVSRLKWILPDGTRAVQFVLQDVNDRPGTRGFELSAGSATETIHRQANGALNYVTVLFGANEAKEINMHMWRSDTTDFDGFGLTAVTVSKTPAPVPLPATALLLAGGIGSLVAATRRRRKTA